MYLYIFEDGTIGVDVYKPTQADLECINDGVLQVFTYDAEDSTFLEIDSNGKECRASEACLNSIEGQTFHQPK